eukprot:4712674-Prymnesium_polylepis.1
MPPIPGKTLFIGDSDIDYWSSPSPFPGSYNVGNAGDTCTNVLSEVDVMLATFSPANVVLVCGENDLDEGRSPTQTFNTFTQIVTKVVAVARVLYIGTKPEPATTSLHSSYRQCNQKKLNSNPHARRVMVVSLIPCRFAIARH